MAWSNCMISAGLAPRLFPIAVFIVWRLKIVPGTGHILFQETQITKCAGFRALPGTVLRFRQSSVKGLVDECVHGLSDAHYAREHDAPYISTVESAGGGDGDDAEPDGCGEEHGSDVSAGEYTS